VANVRFVNPNSTAGGDGTTNATAGANRAYVSLSAWEAARQGVLADVEQAVCESGGNTDTTACTIDGSTTDATKYMEVTASATGRHAGVLSTGGTKYLLSVNAAFAAALTLSDPFTRVSGIQVRDTSAGGTSGMAITVTAATCLIDAVLISDASGDGLNLTTGCGGTAVRNCVVYGYAGEGANVRFGEAVTIDNCTFAGGTAGVGHGGGASQVVRNCYAGNTSSQDFTDGDVSNPVYTTCRCEDGIHGTATAYATGSGARFTNITAGSENFHIQSGSALIGAGTDLSATFTTDVDGATRSAPWDVGADEFVSAATTAPPPARRAARPWGRRAVA
jgi:parallel beta helix pectate lyase-like protein